MNDHPDPRRYRGQSIADRQTKRRDQLLAAAIRIYGESGYHKATVKEVCAAAGLTERYFYESFTNSESLLLAVYARVNQQLIDGITNAVKSCTGDLTDQLRVALAYYFTALQQDQKLARIFLIELSGISPAVDRAQGEAQDVFATFLLQTLDPDMKLPATQRHLLAHGVVGGITNIALCWIRNGHATPLQDLVPAAMALCRLLCDAS
jgi:AcrR family transcriptional regulator